MSNSIVAFETESGETIYVETNDPVKQGSATRSVRSGSQATEKSTRGFDNAMGVVSHVGNQIVKRVQSFATEPDEVKVDIGICFSAEAGAFIAKASTEGSLNLTMVWRKAKK